MSYEEKISEHHAWTRTPRIGIYTGVAGPARLGRPRTAASSTAS